MKIDRKAFYGRLGKLAFPIIFQSLMLAAVAAADAVMLGRIEQNQMAAVAADKNKALEQKRILEQHGSDMAHVIRAEVLLSDFSERNEMNAEYVKHFPAEALPARLCYGGVALADDCKIEIIAIARKAV